MIPMCVQMKKSSNIRIRVEPELHQQFSEACRSQDIPVARVLRKFMRQYVNEVIINRQTDMFDFGMEQSMIRTRSVG